MEEIADAFQVPLIWEDEPKAPYIATASLPASMEKLLELYDPLPYVPTYRLVMLTLALATFKSPLDNGARSNYSATSMAVTVSSD